MASPAFDTLRFQQKLSEVLDSRTATVMAEAFAEATQNFVSKADLEALRSELKADSALLRQEFRADSNALRGDMGLMRAEVADKLRSQTFTLLGGVGVIVTGVAAVSRLLH